jgi:hypothetical protein
MGKFILVGNSEYIKTRFSPKDAVRQVLERIIRNGEYIDSREVERSFRNRYKSDEWRPNSTPLRMFDETDFYDAFIDDLTKAKTRIVIFSPFVSKRRVANLLLVFKEILGKKICT